MSRYDGHVLKSDETIAPDGLVGGPKPLLTRNHVSVAGE